MKLTRQKNCKVSRNILVFNVVLLTFSFILAVDGNKTEPVKNVEVKVISTSTASPVPIVANTSPTTTTTTTTKTIASSTDAQTLSALNILQLASHPAFKLELPQTLPDFIRSMMLKYGEAKAAEAFQSLDQLPLGLIMKVLLVEVDKSLAADIVEMQRYAQSQDKALIMMIGRIVAGDKNVPKEIFAMDQKLMKFPWWMRIRQRMFQNLEKYVAAYSLVPVTGRRAPSSGTKSIETSSLGVPLPKSELASAVAASATETYISSSTTTTPVQPVAAAATSVSSLNAEQEALKSQLSLLSPLIQQQQILESLALANAAASSNVQQQQQQKQQQQAFNPLAFLLG